MVPEQTTGTDDTNGRRRAAEVVAQMTLEEELSLLEGHESWYTHSVERLGLRRLMLTDGPHGVRKVRTQQGGGFDVSDNEYSSAFPTSVTVASSWNPDNAHRIGAAIAEECLLGGVDVLLAPGINIQRSPLCGRNFEYYSEDPLLAGAFGADFVRGVQSRGVGCTLKHFAANSNEEYRFVGNSVVDERALREIYLRAFEHVVMHAHPWAVMTAYNRLNSVFCSQNRELLTTVLREEWGFDGLVMTDWGATDDRVRGVEAGCDLDMPGSVPHNTRALVRALDSGRLDPALVHASAGRVVDLHERCSHRPAPVAGEETVHARAMEIARDVAIDSAVLLTNDGTLPLDPARPGVVVVGEMFERLRFQGAGSSLITPRHVINASDAFDRRGIDYTYARGYRAFGEEDFALADEAVAAARVASTVLFFGGLTDLEESEGFDRHTLELRADQQRLLERLLDTGVPVVLVLHAGAPVVVPHLDRLAAVLDLCLPGMAGGEAAAALLFGEENPSGHLAQSWPRRVDDVSCAADFDCGVTARYYESVYVGYRFHDAARTDLLFPFGHGLSYTTFSLDDLHLNTQDGTVRAGLTLTNTGERPGSQVVQLYVRNPRDTVFRPDKELRAFTKVRLAPGESTTVDLCFRESDLSVWDVASHAWVLPNGDYEVLVGTSCVDTPLRAPLPVTSGVAHVSPYSSAVEADWALPPSSVPASFPQLVGHPVEVEEAPRRLGMDVRLTDARHSLLGWILHTSVVAAVSGDVRKARRLPDSLERDARIKNTSFVVRMMPFNSLRSMAMSSGGGFPWGVAAMLAELAHGHPLRAVASLRDRLGDRILPGTVDIPDTKEGRA